MSEANEQMRAEFMAWVRDRGCDTDGAWSAWQAASAGKAVLVEALRDILRENVLSPEGGHETVAEIHCIAREALKLTGSDE